MSEPRQPESGERRYVVVCRGPHCRERGSLPLRARLASLVRGRDDLALVGYNCFGQCELGPNVLYYPEGTWVGGLSEADAAAVIGRAEGRAHECGLPIELPAEERATHLANVAVLIATLEADRQRTQRSGARRWWPF